MIEIKKSKTADTRSCDYSKVEKDQLMKSSIQHISDVAKGLDYFGDLIDGSGALHDIDKLTDIDGFHRDFLTGFEKTDWWDNHRKVSRHHVLQEDGVPKDVNLIDVLEMIVDCVMAGMGRTGEVYPLNIGSDVLMTAFTNTVELLKSQVKVKDAE